MRFNVEYFCCIGIFDCNFGKILVIRCNVDCVICEYILFFFMSYDEYVGSFFYVFFCFDDLKSWVDCVGC